MSSITAEQPSRESQRQAAEKYANSPQEAGKLGFGASWYFCGISCVTLAQSLELSGPSFPHVSSVTDKEGAQLAAGGDHHASLPLLHGAPHHPPWGDGRSLPSPSIQLTYSNSHHFSFKK